MIVRQRWGAVVFFAVLLHLAGAFFAEIFLFDEDEDGAPVAACGELAWLDIEHDVPATEVPPPELVIETPIIASEGVEELPTEPEVRPLPLLPEKPAENPRPKAERAALGGEQTKPPKKRDYPLMRKPNKPAVLREETKRGLNEKETSYRGHVQFFADISAEGRVTDIQAWQFEPDIADKKERRLLEERLKKRIEESWRYAPSLTPDGVPTTQTKREELDIPEAPPVKEKR